MTINTSCKECVFATFSHQGHMTQTGCKFGRIKKYIQEGAVVVTKTEYDDSMYLYPILEYYRILGRVCLLCRQSQWGRKKLPQHWKKLAYQEASIQCHIILIANQNLKELFDTLKSIRNQTLKPRAITIVLPNNISTCELRQKLIKLLNKKSSKYIKWKIENAQDNFTDEELFTLVVDIEKDYQYHMLLHAGIIVPKCILSQINKAIINDMKQIFYIGGNSNNDGFFVSGSICKYFGAHHKLPLIEKIKFELTESEWKNKIFQINQLCPSFPI